jgi:hypothetical protein
MAPCACVSRKLASTIPSFTLTLAFLSIKSFLAQLLITNFFYPFPPP